MNIYETLDKIKEYARSHPDFRKRLLETKDSPRPYSDFCKICTEEGFPIYAMDLVNAGEEYYAAMRRSTNGGGENSPMLDGQDDYYEMLLIQLGSM